MSDTYTVLDVSSSVTISNYNSVVDNVDGILLRAGYRGYGQYGTIITDSMFENFYRHFYGKTPLGVYFFTQAVTQNDAEEEAVYLYNLIKNKDLKFPIYINSDYSSAPNHSGRADGLSRSTRTDLVNIFCRKFKSLGYRAGIMSEDTFFRTNLDPSLLDRDYSIIITSIDTEPVYNRYDAWRYTNSGRIPGINTGVNLSTFVKDVAGWETGGEVVDIVNLDISLEYTSTVYDGSPKEPAVTIINDNGKELVKGRDYLVVYVNDVNAGEAYANLTGINNYKGNVYKYYTIEKANIHNVDITFNPPRCTYTGEQCKPEVIINGLTPLIDYTNDYGINIDAGSGTAVTYGINNYTGTRYDEFEIAPKDIMTCDGYITPTRFIFNDQPCEPLVYMDNMEEGVDYTKEYQDNIYEGTGKVILTGIGNYTGTKVFTFNIVVNNIELFDVNIEYTEVTYNRSPYEPKITIDKLTEGTDFKVEYFNNVNAGTGTARVTGIGDFVGVVRKTFTIKKKDLSELVCTFDKLTYPYTGKEVHPVITMDDGAVQNEDYKCTYYNAVDPGEATVKLTAKGNYLGGFSKNFIIDYQQIDNCVAKYGVPSVKTIYRVGMDGPFELYSENVLLTENKDYVIKNKTVAQFEDFYLVTLDVSGLNGIVGDITYRFRVIEKEPDEPIDYTDDGVYNFGDIDIGDESAEGNYDFGDLDEGYPEPTKLPEETDMDFDDMAGGMHLADYDEDDGTNVDPSGGTTPDDPSRRDNPDDGTFNYGDIDEGDETAEGDYDYGDIDEGVDEDSVVPDNTNHDFNILCYEEDELLRDDIRFQPGTEYMLVDTDFYNFHSAKTSFDTRSGTHIIYKSDIVNNRIRMSRSSRSVNNPVRMDGWVNVDDLLKIIEFFPGTEVMVTGYLYEYATGKGYRTKPSEESMFISTKLDYAYTHRYGISQTIDGPVLGYASEEQLTKVNENY